MERSVINDLLVCDVLALYNDDLAIALSDCECYKVENGIVYLIRDFG